MRDEARRLGDGCEVIGDNVRFNFSEFSEGFWQRTLHPVIREACSGEFSGKGGVGI
jgi:hypothetical protein